MPGWRNGRRKGLKILRPQGHVGSTPTPGTRQKKRASYDALFFWLVCSRWDENPSGFGNRQRGGNKNSNEFLFPTSEPIRADSYPPLPTPGTTSLLRSFAVQAHTEQSQSETALLLASAAEVLAVELGMMITIVSPGFA